MSIKILHCADLHLDKTFDFARHEQSLKRREDLQQSFSRIVDYALKHKPDLFLVAGDVFDRVNPSNDALVFLTHKIRTLRDAGIHVYLIAGNHDIPKTGMKKATALDIFDKAGLCKVFSDTEKLQKDLLTINNQKVYISGKSFDPLRERESPLKGQAISAEGDINILVLHASFHESGPQNDLPAAMQQHPITPEEIPSFIHYVALGHIHKPFLFKLASGGYMGNPGSIEMISLNEKDYEHGFIEVECGSSALLARFIQLPTRPYEVAEFELSETMKDLTARILEFLEARADPEKLFWLHLKGHITPSQHDSLDLRQVYEAAENLFFAFHIDRQELKIQGYGRIYAPQIKSPIQAFQAHIDALKEQVVHEEDRRFLEAVKQKGLYYLTQES